MLSFFFFLLCALGLLFTGEGPAEDDGNNNKGGDGDWSAESEDGETRPPPNVRSKGGPVIKG